MNRDSSSIAVVGAGVVGLSIAFHLLERGVGSVTVVEREGVAAGASGVQPGGVRQQWSTPLGCRLARDAYGFYRDFAERVPSLTQPRLDPCGYLFVADEETTVERLSAGVAVQQEFGIPSRLVGAAEAARIAPALSPAAFAAASYCPEDGYFDQPQAVVEAFAHAVRVDGGEILIATVEAIERDGSGWRLLGRDVPAEPFDAVVVAAGYDTPTLLPGVPIVKRPRYLFFSEPIRERLLEPLVIAVDRGIAVKQLANGRVLASDLHAGEDGTPDEARWRRRLRGQMLELLPLLEYVSLPILVEGFYDMTPDAQPLVDRLDDGLWVAAGFSGHGFMVAPAVGRLVADGLVGAELPEWATQLGLDRLATASDVERQVI